MKIIELVARPGTGKTTLSKKICDNTPNIITRNVFFKRELARGWRFKALPDIITDSFVLEPYITRTAGGMLENGSESNEILLEILSIIIGDLTSHHRLQLRMDLLFRDYAIQQLAQKHPCDKILLLDEGLVHRIATFTLNGLKPSSFLKILDLLPTADAYAFIEIDDRLLKRNLLKRDRKDTLFIDKDVYQNLKGKLMAKDSKFITLSPDGAVSDNIELLFSAAGRA